MVSRTLLRFYNSDASGLTVEGLAGRGSALMKDLMRLRKNDAAVMNIQGQQRVADPWWENG